MNDLGQLGAIVRAYIFSITTDSADSKKHDALGRHEKHTHGRCRVTSLRGGVGVRHPSGRRVADYLFSHVGWCAAARYGSNSAPKAPQSGVPATHSQHPPRLSGAAAALETGCTFAGSMAYVSGLAAAVFAISNDLSTARRG